MRRFIFGGLALVTVIRGVFRSASLHYAAFPAIDSNIEVAVAEDEPISSLATATSSTTSQTIAYAVTVTSCNPHHSSFVDGIAVLGRSIQTLPNSSYSSQLYAFCRPEALEACPNLQHQLEQFDYTVQSLPTPILLQDIHNEELREAVQDKSFGCCEEHEFLKLYALTLTDHPVVVLLDADVLVLKPLDPLFDAMLAPDHATKPIPFPDRYLFEQYPHNNDNTTIYVNHPIETYYTRDYNSANKYMTPPERVGMQGGFWIVKPNLDVFHDMLRVIQDVNSTHFFKRYGWGSRELFPACYHGYPTIQGFISYYYGYIRPGVNIPLNQCRFNAMATEPHMAYCPNGIMYGRSRYFRRMRKNSNLTTTATMPLTLLDCEDCREAPWEEVYSAHFTVCNKPWACMLQPNRVLCNQFLFQWHLMRAELEDQRSYSRVMDSFLEPMWKDRKMVLESFSNQCRDDGYKPMILLRNGTATTAG